MSDAQGGNWLAGLRAGWGRAARRRDHDMADLHYKPAAPVRDEYVNGLQKDAMVLLRYVTSRPDRPLSMPGMREPTEVSAVIFGRPNEVGSDAHIDQLQQLLDQLSRLAAPATATSIRLTQAYLQNPSIDGEPPPVIRRQAQVLRGRLHWIRGITLALLGVTMVMLIHATAGRQALEQLNQQQAALTVLEDRLALAASQRPGSDWEDCLTGSRVTQEPGVASESAVLKQTCFRRMLVLREQETTRGLLAEWDCRSGRLFGKVLPWQECPYKAEPMRAAARSPAMAPRTITARPPATAEPGSSAETPANPMESRSDPPEDIPLYTVIPDNSVSIVATNFLGTFNSFILPLLVGTLGGGAFVLRRFDSKIREMTLLASEASHAWFRIALAAIMGGLLGVVWDGGSNVQVGDFSFSITAIAFFVGFSLEIVFSVIEVMVGSIAGRLTNGPITIPPTPFLMPTSPSRPPPSSSRPAPPPAVGEAPPISPPPAPAPAGE